MILKSTSDYRSFLNPDASVTISIRTDDQVHSVRVETEASGKVFGDCESKFQIVTASAPTAHSIDRFESTTLDAYLVSQAERDFEAFIEMRGEAYL